MVNKDMSDEKCEVDLISRNMKQNKKFAYKNGIESSLANLISGFGETNSSNNKKIFTLDVLHNQCTYISEEI